MTYDSSYDAVIIKRAPRDAPLDILGVELQVLSDGAEFVGWYNDHPDSSPQWPRAESVAVIGGGTTSHSTSPVCLAEAAICCGLDVFDRTGDRCSRSRSSCPARTVALLLNGCAAR